MQRRTYTSLLCLLLTIGAVSLLVAGCRQARKPIKIGLAVTLSGTGGGAGEHIRDGAQLAVEEVNRQGGINGQPLQLLIQDDHNTDEGIREADNFLIHRGVLAIIGHSNSSDTLIAYPMVTRHNTILITSFTATTKLTGKDDLFLRTSVDCNEYGRKMARLLARKNAKKVSVLLDMENADFVTDFMTFISRDFAGELFPVSFNSRKVVDWSALIAKLTTPAPDSVILLTEAAATGIALQKLDQAGFTGNRFATVWAQRPELLQLAGNAANGLAIVTFFNPENHSPEYQQFDREMHERFHIPANALSCRAHEIVHILADALGRCRTLTVPALKTALLQGRYHTSMGEIGFDANGDVIRPVYQVVVRNGQFVNSGVIN